LPTALDHGQEIAAHKSPRTTKLYVRAKERLTPRLGGADQIVSTKRRNRGAPPRSAGYLGSLGQVLAAVALVLQMAVPSLHCPIRLIFQNSAGDLAGAYDEHALCLAQGSGDPTPEAPVDQVPKPTHQNLAACCFWHGSTGFALAPTATIEPITFQRSVVDFKFK
jgi:hypothetical protein